MYCPSGEKSSMKALLARSVSGRGSAPSLTIHKSDGTACACANSDPQQTVEPRGTQGSRRVIGAAEDDGLPVRRDCQRVDDPVIATRQQTSGIASVGVGDVEIAQGGSWVERNVDQLRAVGGKAHRQHIAEQVLGGTIGQRVAGQKVPGWLARGRA